MRAYIDYTTEGRVCGIHTGLPSGCDPLDSTCEHPVAQNIRHNRPNDYAGTLISECECHENCSCAWTKASGRYVVNGQLETLPRDVVFEINGSSCGESVDLEPGKAFTLVVKCPALGGSSGELRQRGQLALHVNFPNPVLIPFTDGTSQPERFVAPAQGMTGELVFSSGVRTKALRVRGFAT